MGPLNRNSRSSNFRLPFSMYGLRVPGKPGVHPSGIRTVGWKGNELINYSDCCLEGELRGMWLLSQVLASLSPRFLTDI